MRAARGLLTVAAMVSLAGACSGRALDVGSSEDGGRESVDGGAAGTDVGVDSGMPRARGFVVDGEVCEVTRDSGTADWPKWRVVMNVTCPRGGQVRFVLESDAQIAYPQPCSFATTAAAGFDAEGDAGTLYYEAAPERGPCQVTTGPTPTDPAFPLSFEVTLRHAFEPSRQHTVSYRGPGAP